MHAWQVCDIKNSLLCCVIYWYQYLSTLIAWLSSFNSRQEIASLFIGTDCSCRLNVFLSYLFTSHKSATLLHYFDNKSDKHYQQVSQFGTRVYTQNPSIDFDSKLGYWLIREAKLVPWLIWMVNYWVESKSPLEFCLSD